MIEFGIRERQLPPKPVNVRRGSSPTVMEGSSTSFASLTSTSQDSLPTQAHTPQLMVRDYDDNELPLAYFISFRTYGTWLHGDDRGSVDRRHNRYGTTRLPPNPFLKRAELEQMKHAPFKLNARQRPVVEEAIREVCANRGYWLRAVQARTNHVHSVVSAEIKPEPILQAFQAYATRKLRLKGLLPRNIKPWSRHGSNPYLWKEKDVEEAIEYVLFGQGKELPRFDD